jgi:glycosyltransferase involved in cell wall biosynthesis
MDACPFAKPIHGTFAWTMGASSESDNYGNGALIWAFGNGFLTQDRPPSVPEPPSLALLGSGLAWLYLQRRSRAVARTRVVDCVNRLIAKFMPTLSGRTLAMLLDSAPQTWSSIEELHDRFARALITRGIQPVLVFSDLLPHAVANRFKATGAAVETINYEKGILHYYQHLGRLIRRYAVTVVHIAFFNYFDLVPWLARLKGVRQIVYQEHNSGVLRAGSWKKRLIRFRACVTTMPMTRAIAISEFIRRQLIEVGIPEDKVSLVYNGVNTQRFSPDPGARKQWAQRFAIEPDEIVVSSIAHLRPFKHPEVIVEALGLLRERGVKARLFMAGGGEMRQDLEDLSRSLGISQRVHWLGSCANVESLLQASDIFVLASVGEAFGLVLAEAMACCVPVVGSRSGAIPEIVEDGKTGLLATPLNSSSFAEAIQRLACDNGLRRKLGQCGLERVHRHFTTETFLRNILRAYESVWSSGT